MKKLTQSLFLLMTASVVLAAPISSYAQNASIINEESGEVSAEWMKKIENELQKAKTILPYLKDYPVMEVEVNDPNAGGKVRLYQADMKKYPHVIMNVDPSGKLLTFTLAKGEKTDFTYPLEQAKEKAIAFMKQWYGEDLGGYQLNQKRSDHTISITFHKVVHGIPVLNDAVILSVDGQGQIIGKGVDGNRPAVAVNDQANLRFADPKEALPKEQVEKMFASFLKPYYALAGDGKTYKLLYAPKLSGEIDARTGLDRSPVQDGTVVAFQPKGKEPKVRSKEEAAAFLQAQTGYDFTKGRTLFEESPFADGTLTSYLWQTEDGIIGNLFADAKTGVITNYQIMDNSPDKKTDKKLGDEQALRIAVEKLSEFLPPDLQKMVLTESGRYDQDNNLYLFDFVLEHQGIMVSDWRTQAHVDAHTGKVLLLRWKLPQKGALPDPQKAISPEEAARLYLQDHPLELYYSLDKEKEGSFSLVYIPAGEEWEMDAFTGVRYVHGEE